MKKQLLFLACTFMFSAYSVKAQTTTFDFSNDTTNWPLNAGVGNSDVVKHGLGFHPLTSNTNFGAVTNNTATSFSDGYTGNGDRLQSNGGGSAAAGTYKPIQRYFFIQVDKACTVSAWYKSGSAGSKRTVFVSDGGSTLYGSQATDPVATDPNPDQAILVNVAIPAAGTFYIYSDSSINYYKMTVVGANIITTTSSDAISTLATTEVVNRNLAKIYTSTGSVHINNILADSKVSVYTSEGRLVKSLNTTANADIQLKTGYYIVTVKSAKGSVSQKVLVK